MNELQKVEFDIFQEFVKICEQLNLEYYLVCGTALGAIKYQGFIPWDDDIDVGLFRKDYEVFCQEAQKLLPEKYFLQTYKTDKNYPNIHCKIRDSETTYIEKSVSNLDINQGIFIDVFPLDGYPKTILEQRVFELRKKTFRLLLTSVYKRNEQCSVKARLLFEMVRVLRIHKRTNRILNKYDKMLSSYLIEESDFICNHGNWQGKLEYAPRWHYGDGTWAEFEGIKVRIPERYDEYLTQKYGDWRHDLPKEQQVGHHYYEVCDVNKSYTEYV